MIRFLTLFPFTYLMFMVSALQAQQLAFPTADGFARYTKGGRGGTVYHVTNLNDTGPGSLRDAVSKPNRTVVFDIGGVIRITERLIFSSNLTIAGQTAPGGGITVYGNGVSYSNANNTITRYVRFRMSQNGTSGKDAIAIAEGHDIIMDHVSVSWGRDGTLDVNGPVTNFTFQDGIISQGLQTHSTGGLIQSDLGTSIIRCLYIDNHTRNPKVKGKNQFVNNIIYNWNVGGYILGDSEGKSWANVTGNYFINGPSESDAPFTRGNLNFNIYAANNYHDSNRNEKLDGAVIPKTGYGTVTWQNTPYAYPLVKEMTPANAYNFVLKNAGASLKRDQVDTRMMLELSSLGTLGAIIAKDTDSPMSGPGTVASGTKPVDTDQDGMPDAWEKTWGLNPNVADNNGDADRDGYTNLEQYINCLVGEGNCTKVVAGISEESDSQSLHIYPNPFTEGFSITVKGLFSYEIVDLSGTSREKGSGENLTNLGSNLPSGLYIVKINNDKGSLFVKISKY